MQIMQGHIEHQLAQHISDDKEHQPGGSGHFRYLFGEKTYDHHGEHRHTEETRYFLNIRIEPAIEPADEGRKTHGYNSNRYLKDTRRLYQLPVAGFPAPLLVQIHDKQGA